MRQLREIEGKEDPESDGQTKLERIQKVENWEEIQENRKWENRDGWRFFYNS